ncbi:hypothetical protein C2W62_24895 [Candidatus Entotheonella serta]|nr:hypothetical protein C2W62_24895 [Candidatus Entotheonella serta]
MKSQSPLSSIFAVRKSELPLTLMMFSYFFLVITSFWILKPLKKALFIQFYDEQGFTMPLFRACRVIGRMLSS